MMVHCKVWHTPRTDAKVFKTAHTAAEFMMRLRKDSEPKLARKGTGGVIRYVVTFRTVGNRVPYAR